MNATDWAEFLTLDLSAPHGRLVAADWLQERTDSEALAELLRRFEFVPAVGARALWNARPTASEPKQAREGAYWFERPVTGGELRLSVFRVAEIGKWGSMSSEPGGWHAYMYSRVREYATPDYQWHGAVEPTPARVLGAGRASRRGVVRTAPRPLQGARCTAYSSEPTRGRSPAQQLAGHFAPHNRGATT